MEDKIFVPALFGGLGDDKSKKPPKEKNRRKTGYRNSDLVLNKQNILDCVEFTTPSGQFPIPIIKKVDPFELPTIASTFSKAVCHTKEGVLVVFYEPDVNFARVLHNPKRYVETLRKFSCVVGPDFSQKIGMNSFIRFSNNWWNKVLTAYYQSQGILMIPNVTWSTPSSYDYAFTGIPKHSVIAINSTGIIGNPAAIYLWRKGYEEVLFKLKPTIIIRYGDKIPGEREGISVYYENLNLRNLRNGRKRISC